MTLTKAMIAEEIAKEKKLTKKRSFEVIEIVLEIIKKSLQSGEDVLVSGFGKFCVNEKKARRGRNPTTGDDLIIRPRRVVTFKCSGKLRKKINS